MRQLLNGLLLLLLLAGNAAARKPYQHGLKVSHLTGDFYIYTTWLFLDGKPFPANGMYLLTHDGAVIFDSPWNPTQFQPLLDYIQQHHHQKVIVSIATHSHADRTRALDYFAQQGIRTYTSAKTDSISCYKKEKRATFLFYSDTTFTVGQHSFRTFYAGPGHTPDNIVIWFDHERILYGGCLVKSTEAKDLGNVADADVQAWPVSVQRIIGQFGNPRYIIPGHQSWDSRKSIRHTLQLLRQANQH